MSTPQPPRPRPGAPAADPLLAEAARLRRGGEPGGWAAALDPLLDAPAAPAPNPSRSAPVAAAGGPDPRIAPRTSAAAAELGYDPAAVNAPIPRRAGAVLLDLAIYLAVLGGVALAAGLGLSAEHAAVVLGAGAVTGPAGFYAYRAAGDAIFEGSPGKRALGLRMSGPHGLPVSGGDGLRRNLWILPSLIPVAGWLVTAAMMVWIAVGMGSDPLGRGPHERATGTRVTEAPGPRLP